MMRLTRCLSLVAVAAAVLMTAQTALAHSLFIQSTRYTVHNGKKAPLYFGWGHHIPLDDGIQGKKLKYIKVLPPDGQVRDLEIREGRGLHSHSIEYDQEGTWMHCAETNPGYYTIYLDKKGKEHHAIKPLSRLKNRAGKILLSVYTTQFTKTYVACKAPSKGPLPRSNQYLELVAADNLFDLKPGDTIDFQVYLDGKPYGGEGSWDASYGGYSTLSEDMFHPKTVSRDGTFSLTLPNAGEWYVRYHIKIPAPEADREKYHQLKLSTSTVFLVPTPPKKKSE